MRRHSAAAVVAALTAFLASVAVAAPVARAVTSPQPVSNLRLGEDGNAVVTGGWTNAPDADEAVMCWSVGDTAPTAPVATSTTSCNRPTASGFDDFQGTAPTTYSLSVFSYRSSDAAYGPPVSAQLTTTQNEVANVEITATGGTGAHSLALRWDVRQAFDDSDDLFDVTSWIIRDRQGMTPPSMHRHPVKVIPTGDVSEASATIGGLKSGVPYTFTVVARASDGRLGQPDSTVAGTREPGDRVSSPRHSRWMQHLLPSSDGLSGSISARVQSTGRTEALYTSIGKSQKGRLRFSSGRVGGSWTGPTTFASTLVDDGLQLARSPDGTLVATWQYEGSFGYYRIHRAGSRGWQATHRLPGPPSTVLAVCLDEHDRIHAIIDQNSSLQYATFAHGSWSVSDLRDLGPYPAVAIAYDRSRHRVVVAAANNDQAGSATLAVATAPETAKRLGRPHVVMKRSLTETSGTVIDSPSVAATGGRIIVGATLIGESDDDQVRSQPVDHAVIRSTGLVVATGRSAARMARPVVVRGTGSTDSGLRVTLAGPRRLVAVWTRRTTSFRPTDGAYELVAHARGAHSWSFGKARQVLAGHYTFGVVGALASGRPVVVTRTISRDTIVDD